MAIQVTLQDTQTPFILWINPMVLLRWPLIYHMLELVEDNSCLYDHSDLDNETLENSHIEAIPITLSGVTWKIFKLYLIELDNYLQEYIGVISPSNMKTELLHAHHDNLWKNDGNRLLNEDNLTETTNLKAIMILCTYFQDDILLDNFSSALATGMLEIFDCKVHPKETYQKWKNTLGVTHVNKPLISAILSLLPLGEAANLTDMLENCLGATWQ